MKNQQKTASQEKQRGLWEVFLVRDDGDWAGFRIDIRTLKRLSNILVLLLCLLSLSLVGWVLARWKMAQSQRDLAFAQLELQSKTSELEGIKNLFVREDSVEPGGQLMADLQKENSLLPTLEARDRNSALMTLSQFRVEFENRQKRLQLSFELERNPPREGTAQLYWILLLHGPQGVLSFPKAFSSRGGDLLIYHRGQALELKSAKRSVNSQFRVPSFVQEAGSDRIYATLLIYDEKGSLLLRRRSGLEVSQ